MTYLGYSFPPCPWNKPCVSYMGMYFCITHTCVLPQVLQESIEEVLHPAGWEQNKGPDTSQKLIHKVFNTLSPFMLWLLLLKQVIARTKSFPLSKGRISFYCWLLQFKLCPYSTNKQKQNQNDHLQEKHRCSFVLIITVSKMY